MTIRERSDVENESLQRKREVIDLQMLLNRKEKELSRVHQNYENVKSVLCKQEKEMEKIKGF